MDLSSSVIHSWRRQSKPISDVQPADTAGASHQEDVNRLRRRVRELELERDILKKATVWFAKHAP
jgi:transposase-like protein